MKKSIHLFVFYLLLTFPIFIQAQQNTFSKVLYDLSGNEIHANSILPINDGFIVTGYSVQKGLIFKMDSASNVVWNKIYSNDINVYPNIIINSLILSNDSSYIAVGDCYTAAEQSRNALCIKLNFNGDTLWSKTYKPTGSNSTTLLSVQQTIDSGYIMTGYVENPDNKVFVAKTDISGNLQWANQLACGNTTNIGYSVKQTSDSGYVLSGSFDNYPPYEINSYLIKLTKTGDISWSKKYQQAPYLYQMGGFDIEIIANGYILYSAGAVVKTDLSGNVLWNKFYSSGGGLDYQNSIAPKLHRTSDGGFVFISYSSCNQSSMIKTDTAGNLMWSNYLELFAIDVIETKDKGYLSIGNGPLCGMKKDFYFPQIGVIKMDSLGYEQDCIYQINWDSSFVGTIESSSCTFSTITGAAESLIHPDIDSIDIDNIYGCVARYGGVQENESKNDISISPNPTTGKINIQVSQNFGKIKTLEIFDCIGQLQIKETDNFYDTDISSLKSGLYFIILTNDNEEKLKTKVLKE